MGSKKKKQEKRKDFVKQRLKVGKTAKAANFTDTSFKSKGISLPNQAIGAKSIEQYISLTRHHSFSTRKEVLVMLQKHIPNDPKLKQQLIKALIPMITDDAKEVRDALLELMKMLVDTNMALVEVNSNQLILYIHSAMNHINPSVHNGSVGFVNLIVDNFPLHLIKSHFVKTLDGYFNLLGWTKTNNKSVSSVSKKNLLTHLASFNKFLDVSLQESESSDKVHYNALTHLYTFPTSGNPFTQLNLFSVLNGSSTDLVSRKKVIVETYKPWILFNSKSLLNDTAEVSRLAQCIVALVEGLE
ncbi:rRNA processing protein [Yamadazyma tenuis]|uniref:Pre-rRNA-processing protein n=1 Tax=Candida tenuis (strain ATCC 10573 / BCRC 21748 / CBS 615 / JCM 9827 / NBRC 10315 / NRRL Y-1498 / VKM Y-70) TaxID=590646 RepID=G3B316_CANTC|nr:uncharacterized protein CANTEDRAFT_105496 [Yamadazyma tenuis ATCC 10573]EGV64057.1 hypothetical protein CANTEDRAFT_105496 [Yamadazyma tenuis ATCC 10573]WEJ96313.1 rRNA processing protein [Yamadazyma tenuis]